MNRVVSVAGIGVCLAGAALLSAQGQPETRLEGTFEHRVEGRTFAAQAMPAQMGIAGQAGTFHWVGAGPGMEGQVVKNAPYSAEGVTETSRSLADGTKISQKSRTKVYRDTEGRTRREQTLGNIGDWSAAGEPPTIISISNPVAGETYMLNSRDKTAHKMKVNVDVRPAAGVKALRADPVDVVMMAPTHAMVVDRPPTAVGKETVVAHRTMRAGMGVAAGPNVMFFGDSEAKRESLGERNIEGVMAQGTRTTSTIPVGKIGNDRPINVVHESWYSPELQTVVQSETKDPMSGDVTYRLTNIQRSNPPASLFEIPPDYKMQEGGMFTHKIEVRENKQ